MVFCAKKNQIFCVIELSYPWKKNLNVSKTLMNTWINHQIILLGFSGLYETGLCGFNKIAFTVLKTQFTIHLVSLESADFINSLTKNLFGQILVFAFKQLWKIIFLGAKLIDSHAPVKERKVGATKHLLKITIFTEVLSQGYVFLTL